MSDICPNPEHLAQIADGRLEDADTLRHIQGCDRCASAIAELRHVTGLLTALGRAESGHRADALWTAVASQLDAPSLSHRVPVALADWSRLAGVFTQPRVATAWAMCIAGIASGVWLARVDGSSSSAYSYAESSLADETAAGLADLYAESFDLGLDDGTSSADDARAIGDSTDAHD